MGGALRGQALCASQQDLTGTFEVAGVRPLQGLTRLGAKDDDLDVGLAQSLRLTLEAGRKRLQPLMVLELLELQDLALELVVHQKEVTHTITLGRLVRRGLAQIGEQGPPALGRSARSAPT